MKTFMRSILIGVCILSGYGLVEASDQVSVDTIRAEGCYKPRDSITSEIVKAEFSRFREADRQAIIDRDTKYKIEYNNFRLEFVGQGINNGKKTCTNFKTPIGFATDSLKDQFIHCTITYTRIICFNDVDLTNYDSENAISEDDLKGEPGSKGEYPKFELKSERKWHTVMRIKKAWSSNAEFTIEGSHCLVNGQTTLNVPKHFKDMKFQWTSPGNNDRFDTPTADTTKVTRTNNKLLKTTVFCTVFDGCNNPIKDSVKLVPNQTPASTLTVVDCLPTDSNYMDLVLSNPFFSEVYFAWSGITPMLDIPTANSQHIRFIVPSIHDFRINLETTGGCQPHQITKVVQRKLSNNVKLKILDNDCLIAQHPFRVVTEPTLIGWSLNWMPRQQDYTVALIDRNREDMVTITKNKDEAGFQKIEVRDRACGGSISVIPYITALKMVVKDEKGNTLQSGATVNAGSTITFTAPKHGSITGDKPYTWSISTMRGDFANMITGKGGAERTLTAPSAGESISVTVSYESCRGKESESYTFYSTASGN